MHLQRDSRLNAAALVWTNHTQTVMYQRRSQIGILAPVRKEVSQPQRPDREYAWTDRVTVDVNGAGAALSDPATKFVAGEAEQIA
jgi:hypothetical protein